MKIPWANVDVWSFIGRNDAEMVEPGGAEHRAALAEYRDTGGIVDCYLVHPTNDPDDDSDCVGGPSVEEIDWTGFARAAE